MIPLPVCETAAAIYYHEPVIILRAIAKVEGGWRGARVQDANGTADHGLMQINSVWRPVLHREGWRMHSVQWHDCASTFVGAWILRQELNQAHNFWLGVAWYQSRNPVYGVPFAHKVYRAAQEITDGSKR
ncbi:lytic transglycosylase domain-containing protein [Acidithiobacillus sp. VAN18-1]|uniref:Lytic transglycosylase domain-containing protein n=1 Tax=Igneacidithiobacillus copahuensis TaxID=2724909 RepID=A0AAE3CKD1_9PROT|nr:lytic transglycosylase domain-containing protein [Igneacidithiobacillus copahuensis]MBU2788644.1 lytic transglycosylase domain-containing protein [Igneacidithiobacillus copahuensis]MBU2796672.1 lytic transglycosylase domain-containing protein [Acidithiobacillus sp. VAN18-2]